MVSRRQLLRAAKGRGWMIQAPALEAILDFMNQTDKDDDDFSILERVLDALGRQLQAALTTVVTEELWKRVLQETEEKQEEYLASHNNNNNDDDDDAMMQDNDEFVSDNNNNKCQVELVNAFETPQLVYDSTRRSFRLEDKRINLLGTAADKVRAQWYKLQ